MSIKKKRFEAALNDKFREHVIFLAWNLYAPALIALIICDLDNFKRYNDTYVHVEGDECLRKTAKAFSSVFNRATDLVARYDGEEFVILLPRATPEQAAHLGVSLCKAVEALKIPHIGNAQYGIVTLSAGCHSFIPDSTTILEAVIDQADKALYKAKSKGRNCFVHINEDQSVISFWIFAACKSRSSERVLPVVKASLIGLIVSFSTEMISHACR